MSGLCGIVDFAASRIDLRPSRGLAQPFCAEGFQLCVWFDGRLDNRSELVGLLAPAEGQDVSDTGVLLAAYLEWGVTCTDHLLGDFAFAVWDSGRRRLLCAVDALGLKPLHYARTGSLLVFASDAVQVLHHSDISDDYDEGEIAAWLASQPEHPERSFFAAIRKLPAGHRLVAEEGVLRVERYWDPRPDEIHYARDEDYAAHFREIFARAVADRLRGAGSFTAVTMSGGLDSTSVAAIAHRTGGAVRAYTFAFDLFKECDERDFSLAMAAELGLDVEPIATEHLGRLDWQTALSVKPDTPYFGWYAGYEEIFYSMGHGDSKVLLTGLGGDDLMCGSTLSYAERLGRGDLGAVREVAQHARARSESVVRALYRYFGDPYLPARVNRLVRAAWGRRKELLLPAFIQSDLAHRADLPSRLATYWPRRAFQSKPRQEIYTKLVGMAWYRRIATWHDRNAARFGIEVRHPFLDRRLFEYVLAIPGEQLFRLEWTKNLLRRSMAGVLPEKIRLRSGKTNFAPFLDAMIRQKYKSEITELLKAPRCADLGFIDGDRLRSAYCSYLKEGTNRERRSLWYAITLEIWLRRCEAIRSERRRVPAVVRSAA